MTVPGTSDLYFAAPIKLADRLPAFGVPLVAGEAPVAVDLQPLLDRAYDTGRYAADVRYSRACSPPLAPDQQAWAEGVLRAKGILS